MNVTPINSTSSIKFEWFFTRKKNEIPSPGLLSTHINLFPERTKLFFKLTSESKSDIFFHLKEGPFRLNVKKKQPVRLNLDNAINAKETFFITADKVNESIKSCFTVEHGSFSISFYLARSSLCLKDVRDLCCKEKLFHTPFSQIDMSMASKSHFSPEMETSPFSYLKLLNVDEEEPVTYPQDNRHSLVPFFEELLTASPSDLPGSCKIKSISFFRKFFSEELPPRTLLLPLATQKLKFSIFYPT